MIHGCDSAKLTANAMSTTIRLNRPRFWRTMIAVAVFGTVLCIVYMFKETPTQRFPDKYKQFMQAYQKSLQETRSKRNTTLPIRFAQALGPQMSSGYLVSNGSELSFQSYEDVVELRIIVIAFDRAESLQKCLDSINSVYYDNQTVSVHVWLDRDRATGRPDWKTYTVAANFRFDYKHGRYHVHTQSSHVGIQGQWTNTWRPMAHGREVGVIVEDDINLSKYFWLWLRAAHKAYGDKQDIAGFGLAGPSISFTTGKKLKLSEEIPVFLSRVICTWGYAPNPRSWRAYQEWFYTVEQDSKFEPLVPDILPTYWFWLNKERGKRRSVWEMWHIYFTNNQDPMQWTVLANTPGKGMFAQNRHEFGLHDDGNGTPSDKLFTEWDPRLTDMPLYPPKLDFSGKHFNN